VTPDHAQELLAFAVAARVLDVESAAVEDCFELDWLRKQSECAAS
jgi:hypothetical protein